jgi:hypothetical protein
MKSIAHAFSRPVALVLLIGFLDNAWALQVHESPEGLVAHQLAHVFFAATMALLVYWLESNGFVAARGWRLIQIACLLFIAWNVAAFAGHWTAKAVDSSLILGERGTIDQRILLQQSPWVLLFYILHLDHLLCVPAIFCLFLGIRSLYREMGQERDANP